jgi:hypothetical protein
MTEEQQENERLDKGNKDEGDESPPEAMDEECFKKLSVSEQNAEIARLYDRNRQQRYMLAVKV